MAAFLGWHIPQFTAVAAHLNRMKKLEVIARETFAVERAAALDAAATAFYLAEAET